MKDNRTKLENYVLKNAKSKGGTYDERVMQQSSLAFSTAALCAMFFDVAMMVYYFVKKSEEKSYPYLAQLLVICVAAGLVMMGKGEPGLPRTLSGRTVSAEKSGKAAARRILSCLIDTVVTVAVITGFNIYSEGGLPEDIVKETAIFFTVFMLIETAVCEFRVRRWRKHQAELDAQEDDLED